MTAVTDNNGYYMVARLADIGVRRFYDTESMYLRMPCARWIAFTIMVATTYVIVCKNERA